MKTHAVIINHQTWQDTNNQMIECHDGGITRVGDEFYWYGTSFAGNPQGLYGIMAPRLWNGVMVYSSSNLVDWTYRGKAIPAPDKGWGTLGTCGRPHVIYNQTTKKYVMWYWFHTQHPIAMLMVAMADDPLGPFRVLGPREVGSENGFASDLNVFVDDDGKAYLVYTDHETPETAVIPGMNGKYAIRIDSLSDDYLHANKEGAYVFEHGCEAPALIRYKDKYIVIASGVEGWGGTSNYYAIADTPLGPYGIKKELTGKNNWGGQLTSLLHIKETDKIMAMFDQWWITRDEHHRQAPEAGTTDLNESRYLWLPLELDSLSKGTIAITFLKSWEPF